MLYTNVYTNMRRCLNYYISIHILSIYLNSNTCAYTFNSKKNHDICAEVFFNIAQRLGNVHAFPVIESI